MTKRPKQTEIVQGKKAVQRESLYCTHPKWRFSKADKVAWSIFDFFESNPSGDFFRHLRDNEGMRWIEIMQASGGRSHGTNNHFIKVEDLSPKAKRRLSDMNILEDELFSLRLGGTIRIWGIIDYDGTFNVIWYDPIHEVYPSSR